MQHILGKWPATKSLSDNPSLFFFPFNKRVHVELCGRAQEEESYPVHFIDETPRQKH